MSGGAIIAGLVGAAVALAVAWALGGLGWTAAEAPAAAAAVAVPAGAVLLMHGDAACPGGTVPAGQVLVTASPDYDAAESQRQTQPAAMRSSYAGWMDTEFRLCRAEGP